MRPFCSALIHNPYYRALVMETGGGSLPVGRLLTTTSLRWSTSLVVGCPRKRVVRVRPQDRIRRKLRGSWGRSLRCAGVGLMIVAA